MKTVFLFLALLAVPALAQEKPPEKFAPLTDHETLQLRNKQVALLNLRDQRRQADEEMDRQKKQADDALDKQIQEAQNDLVTVANEVFKSRGISSSEAGICDGPTQGRKECDGVKAGELALRPLPKPEAKQEPKK